MIKTAENSSRLIYIDGLRGIICLWIVLTHCYWEAFPDGSTGALYLPLGLALQPIAFSNKVAVFFVISGYCIFLPFIRARSSIIAGGLFVFIKRRMRRILPPYYASLALSLLLISLTPALQTAQGVRWDTALPAFTPDVLLSHLLLVHNLDQNWIVRINPPLWSLAVEWQIYFLFLLLLLPLWRRFGLTLALTVGFILGFLPHFLLRESANYSWTCPWFLSLFCLGAVAASAFHFPRQVYKSALAGTLIFGMTTLTAINTRPLWLGQAGPFQLWIDLSVGLLTGFFLAYGTSAVALPEYARKVHLLESKIPQILGKYSYSLYLVHFPLLSLVHAGLRSFFTSNDEHPLWRLGLLFVIGVPLSLLAAFVFHNVFETMIARLFTANGTAGTQDKQKVTAAV
ncbi:MAG: acyltransferase [Armatimonadota bacterium]